MSFVICAFVTQNTPYEEVAQNYLIPSLEKLELPYDLQLIDNLGSWNKNTSYKATFAKEMLKKHKGSNIVILDADARILEYPEIFDEIPNDYDIGAFILDRDTWYKNSYGKDRYEFLSGTLFIRNSALGNFLVNQWELECKNTNEWEQKVLFKVLKRFDAKIYTLPMSYCYITSLPDGSKPNIPCEKPVILHYQVSRKYRKIVSNVA